MTDTEKAMIDEYRHKNQREAYEWAKKNLYQSVAARYAHILACMVDEERDINTQLQAKLDAVVQNFHKDCSECSALRAQAEREKGCGCACGETDKNFCATCNKIRVEAIKEKLEQENPKPLTLDELKERVGKIIWRKSTGDCAYPIRINGFTDWCLSYETLGNEPSGLVGINAIEGKFFDHEPKGQE